MQPRITHEHIVSMIKRFAALTIESRQIARRLGKLLPTRLKSLQRSFAVNMSAARAMRQALISDEYQEHLLEMNAIAHQARLARIQYETHLMLISARRSMRRHTLRTQTRFNKKNQ